MNNHRYETADRSYMEEGCQHRSTKMNVNDPCTQEASLMHTSLMAVDEALNRLDNSLEKLQEKLSPVLSDEPEQVNKDDRQQRNLPYLFEQMNKHSNIINMMADRVQMITRRLPL